MLAKQLICVVGRRGISRDIGSSTGEAHFRQNLAIVLVVCVLFVYFPYFRLGYLLKNGNMWSPSRPC